MRNKKIKIIIIVVLGLIVLTGFFYVLTSTSTGLRAISNSILPEIVPGADVQIGNIEGRLSDGVVLRNVELKNLQGFPPDNILRIQKIIIKMKSLDPRQAEVEFENIRLILPNSEPIVLSGSFHHGGLECNLYSRSVSIDEILKFLPHPLSSHPQGVIKDIDLYLSGPPDAVEVKGKYVIGELIMPRFTLTDAPGELALVFKRKGGGYAQLGELSASKGKVQTKFATMKLAPTKLYFSGSFASPTFDIHGSAAIGKVSMDISLLGTPKAPMWQFFSNPSLPEEVLMLMFLTGKSFGTLPNKDFEDQKLTPDVAKDLVDYLLFGGEGGHIAQKFGIKDVSVIYDPQKETAGIGVTKALTDFLDVGYQIEQQGDLSSSSSGTGEIKHTFDTELKLNPNVSVEVDKEIYQSRNQESFGSTTKPDDKILLKYKTQF